MSWRYANYHREAVFPAERQVVDGAARAAINESFTRWLVADTDSGFDAIGTSGWHTAIAKFRLSQVDRGTKIDITLQVERAGPMGLVGWDVFGYYDGEIRKWLEAMNWHLHQGLAAATPRSIEQRNKLVAQQHQAAARFLVGCPLAFLVFFVCIYSLSAVIGLFSGVLFLPARGSGSATIHGIWARIISAAILIVVATLLWKVRSGLSPRKVSSEFRGGSGGSDAA
jgi:hypothetical protein